MNFHEHGSITALRDFDDHSRDKQRYNESVCILSVFYYTAQIMNTSTSYIDFLKHDHCVFHISHEY